MPRPRVHPSQRRRVAGACNFCREVKKKCSGQAPCSHCLRRGIASKCVIALRNRRPGTEDPTVTASCDFSSPGSPPTLNGNGAAAGPDTGPANAARGQYGAEACPRPATPRDARRNDDDDNDDENESPANPGRQEASGVPPVSRNPPSRMLWNLRGERVYIGGAASLSFLQVVRNMVADQIGPSQFSHSAKSDTMLEKESSSSPAVVPPSHSIELDAESRLDYVDCYRAVTEGFIDIFAPDEIESHLRAQAEVNSRRPPRVSAVFGMVVALGAQCKSAWAARHVGQVHFRRAQSQAFAGLLEDPDMDVVRSFLLMAFYLLGECRRNAAFMYLGIATRAAVALGLHSRDSYQELAKAKENTRLRVWISLRIVDMLVNSILGRPAATTGLSSDTDEMLGDLAVAEGNEDTARLIASHQIVSIINDVVNTLYGRKEFSTSAVEDLLGKIATWSQSLPSGLRPAGGCLRVPRSSVRARGVMGSIHVSCLYYFAVTLATRPMVLALLTAPPNGEAQAQSQLASACLDAAVYLVQTCHDAYRLDLLYGNMCVMKALVFAAGLVLGFEIFAKQCVGHNVESAFVGARDVLHFLAAQSPQAAHYYDILTLLSNAIAERRQHVSATGRTRYVSRLLTLRGPEEASASRDTEISHQNCLSCSRTAVAAAAPEEHGSWLTANRAPPDTDQDVFLGWDSLDLSQWDNFPFVT